MERNILKPLGKAGDVINTLLSACRYNIRKLVQAITPLLPFSSPRSLVLRPVAITAGI